MKLTDQLHKIRNPKISVFRPLQLGDLICSIPAFRALRMEFPDAIITLIGLPWAKDFVKRYNMYFDKFISFPGYPGMPEQHVNPYAFPEFLKSVQRERFDLVIQMNGSGTITNPLITLFSGEITAGYFRDGMYRPESHYFMPYPNNLPEVKRHLKLMKFLGIPEQGEEKEFPIIKTDIKEYINLKEVISLVPTNYICIHPGARVNEKQMSPKKFAAIADIFSSYGFDIVLTGTKDEENITEKVKNNMHVVPLDLTGKTTLGSLAILLKHSYMLVSNDTGIAHIADALNVPSVIIFSSSNPIRWAPLNNMYHKVVLQDDIENPENLLNEAEKLMKSVYRQSN